MVALAFVSRRSGLEGWRRLAWAENIDEDHHGVGGAQAGEIYRQRFPRDLSFSAGRIGGASRFASPASIECIGRSDALYHNYEHTWLVTMVGRDILQV